MVVMVLTVMVVISGGGVDDDGLDRLDVMVLMMVQWTGRKNLAVLRGRAVF
jgi:hypothetical protein